MWRWALIGLTGLILASCDMPRDPERTTSLVGETGTIRLGWIENAQADGHVCDALAELQETTGADLQIRRGDSEEILAELAEGKIDLAYGNFAMDSPWSKEVHFGRAIGWRAKPPKHESVQRFAMRRGENGWIMTVEKAARP